MKAKKTFKVWDYLDMVTQIIYLCCLYMKKCKNYLLTYVHIVLYSINFVYIGISTNILLKNNQTFRNKLYFVAANAKVYKIMLLRSNDLKK